MGAPGRREIGHGKLAWRALRPMLPKAEDFPYTIRLVSEITESNGSSSMATVCGSSLALMDAGVPLKKPVSGIAMGLILEPDGFAVLSDILGDEDHLGDMDFKVAGTADGITSLQMDIKIAGITEEIMKQALDPGEGRPPAHPRRDEQGHGGARARSSASTRRRSRPSRSPTDKIREVIGTGGKVIREIVEKTGAKVDIDDDGTIKIAASEQSKIDAASDWIKSIASEPEVGAIYNGKVVKVVDFGAFVNFFGAKDGLVHVSQISNERVGKVSDVLTEGQHREGEAPGLRRSRQDQAVDEGRRPGDRRRPVQAGRFEGRRGRVSVHVNVNHGNGRVRKGPPVLRFAGRGDPLTTGGPDARRLFDPVERMRRRSPRCGVHDRSQSYHCSNRPGGVVDTGATRLTTAARARATLVKGRSCMGQVRTDAQGPEAQRRAGAGGSRARPLSPHLQVWRWHITMAASILHRVTGVALYVGLLIVAGWAVALASGPEAYDDYMGLLGSPLGLLVLFGLTAAIFYHLANGIRHLVWDTGHGLTPKTANMSAVAVHRLRRRRHPGGLGCGLRHGSALMGEPKGTDRSYRTALVARPRPRLGQARRRPLHWPSASPPSPWSRCACGRSGPCCRWRRWATRAPSTCCSPRSTPRWPCCCIAVSCRTCRRACG